MLSDDLHALYNTMDRSLEICFIFKKILQEGWSCHMKGHFVRGLVAVIKVF